MLRYTNTYRDELCFTYQLKIEKNGHEKWLEPAATNNIEFHLKKTKIWYLMCMSEPSCQRTVVVLKMFRGLTLDIIVHDLSSSEEVSTPRGFLISVIVMSVMKFEEGCKLLCFNLTSWCFYFHHLPSYVFTATMLFFNSLSRCTLNTSSDLNELHNSVTFKI